MIYRINTALKLAEHIYSTIMMIPEGENLRKFRICKTGDGSLSYYTIETSPDRPCGMYKPISTYTGRHFDPYHAVAADLDVRDIAHAQSLMTRVVRVKMPPGVGRNRFVHTVASG